VQDEVITLIVRSKLNSPGFSDTYNTGVATPVWSTDKQDFKQGTQAMGEEIKRWEADFTALQPRGADPAVACIGLAAVGVCSVAAVALRAAMGRR
jgi:hypothetical protein